MPQIGTFKKTKDGFTGRIRTLTLDAELVIRAAENADAENAPHYRIFTTDDIETGAGWKRTGERAGDYLSLAIDDPSFTQPLRAHLFQSEIDNATWNLLWTRPSKRDERT
jgi:uncharacterized protein (DUF736 family)